MSQRISLVILGCCLIAGGLLGYHSATKEPLVSPYIGYWQGRSITEFNDIQLASELGLHVSEGAIKISINHRLLGQEEAANLTFDADIELLRKKRGRLSFVLKNRQVLGAEAFEQLAGRTFIVSSSLMRGQAWDLEEDQMMIDIFINNSTHATFLLRKNH